MCYVKTHYALARSFASLEDDTSAKQWCREGKKNGKLNTCRSFSFGYKNTPQFYWGQINERSEQ